MIASKSKCWKIAQCDFRFYCPSVKNVIELYEGFEVWELWTFARQKNKVIPSIHGKFSMLWFEFTLIQSSFTCVFPCSILKYLYGKDDVNIMMLLSANYGKKILMWNVKKNSFIIKLLLSFFFFNTMHTKKIIWIYRGFCVLTKSHIMMKTFCSYW